MNFGCSLTPWFELELDFFTFIQHSSNEHVLLPQAKEEAQEEIAKYKAEREKAFKESEAAKGSGVTDVQAQIVKDTKLKIDGMSSGVVNNKEAVINQLLDKVLNVQPDLHQNFRSGA